MPPGRWGDAPRPRPGERAVSGEKDRSLELAWGVGLCVALIAGGVAALADHQRSARASHSAPASNGAT